MKLSNRALGLYLAGAMIALLATTILYRQLGNHLPIHQVPSASTSAK